MTLGDLRPYSEAKPNMTVNLDINREEFIKLLIRSCCSYGI
jgi:hypothetical protein